jgi:protein-tyrosine phosphatase
MIDIHSHILHGLDDGAENLEEAVAMLEAAALAGTTNIVATPHANLEYEFVPELISERISELQGASGGQVRIHRGCDFHLTYENIEDALAHPDKYTINHRNYLLVEFSDLLIFKGTTEVFAQMCAAGIVPVITHPERNFLLQRRMEDLRAWVELGCLMQVTALSLLGRFGPEARSFAMMMMRRNLVHFIASDAHDAVDRTPRMDAAYDFVAKKFGPERAERLFVTNPGATLCGDPVDTGEIVEAVPPRKWYQFWG